MQSLVAVSAFLFLGGMAAASSNTASGRLVVGWFAAEKRGLVMGIRQTAQPLGVGLGALVIPRRIAVAVLERAEAIERNEGEIKEWVDAGLSAEEIHDRGGYF